MNLLDGYGMDTITMAGPLEAKLAAMKGAGFSQVMLMARDLVGHPGGVKAAVRAVEESGLRPTGFQVLRDFEGLSGHLHSYKVDIAKSMLEMCAATQQSFVGMFFNIQARHRRPEPDCQRFEKTGHDGHSIGHQGGL